MRAEKNKRCFWKKGCSVRAMQGGRLLLEKWGGGSCTSGCLPRTILVMALGEPGPGAGPPEPTLSVCAAKELLWGSVLRHAFVGPPVLMRRPARSLLEILRAFGGAALAGYPSYVLFPNRSTGAEFARVCIQASQIWLRAVN